MPSCEIHEVQIIIVIIIITDISIPSTMMNIMISMIITNTISSSVISIMMAGMRRCSFLMISPTWTSGTRAQKKGRGG